MHDSLDEFRQEYCFTYVDVGARWGAKFRILILFPNSRCIGFEPDPEWPERDYFILSKERQSSKDTEDGIIGFPTKRNIRESWECCFEYKNLYR